MSVKDDVEFICAAAIALRKSKRRFKLLFTSTNNDYCFGASCAGITCYGKDAAEAIASLRTSVEYDVNRAIAELGALGAKRQK